MEYPATNYLDKTGKIKREGGVAVLVDNRLQSRELEIPNAIENVEICGVQIKTNKGQMGILSLYRPPNTNATNFGNVFARLIKKVRKSCCDVIIGLDHNLDLLKSHIHEPMNEFVEKLLELGLLPVITRPTRITKSTATLIDNIIVDHKHREFVNSSVIIDDTSDHLPCVSIVKDVLMSNRSKIKMGSRDLREKNRKRLKEGLMNIEWKSYTNDTMDVNTISDRIHGKIVDEIERFCPRTERVINYSKLRREPWLSAGLMTSIKKAKRLYKNTLMANCTDRVLNEYKEYNSKLQHLKQRAKNRYYFEKCCEIRDNTKKLWQTINKLCGKESDKTSIITSLKIDTSRCNDTKTIANEFGKYFSSVGEGYANKIPPAKTNIDHYLQKLQSSRGSSFLRPTNYMEIKNLLRRLPNKGSSGFDKIDNILLKKLEDELVKPICILTNCSLEQGIFPDLMKNALIVPLYKSKSKEEVCNYRPISLLLTISKLIEKVVYKQVYDYLNLTGQLYKSYFQET